MSSPATTCGGIPDQTSIRTLLMIGVIFAVLAGLILGWTSIKRWAFQKAPDAYGIASTIGGALG